MKFSAFFLATLATSASAFAPSRTASSPAVLSAATLEAPDADKTEAPAAAADSVPAEMNVEKDWEVNGFVKDSDRVMP